MILMPKRCSFSASFQRRLPAQLHDHALRLFVLDDVVDVLPEHRLEVELVGNVEVGRHRFGVAVDHDGFVAALLAASTPCTHE
jgi:hypothetical protein